MSHLSKLTLLSLLALSSFIVACGATPAPTTLTTPSTIEPTAVQYSPDGLTTTYQQNGITVQITLPRKTFWASEMVTAQAQIQNNTTQEYTYSTPRNLFIPAIINERGDFILEDPMQGLFQRGGGLMLPSVIKPGDTVNGTFQFQLPSTPSPTGYSLWVITHLNKQKSAVQIETGPIPVPALEPDAAHQIQLRLQANKDGYTLTAADGNNNPIRTPLTGMMQFAKQSGSIETAGVTFAADNTIKTPWERRGKYSTHSRIEVWAWAPDYATNNVAFSTPGDATSPNPWIAPRADRQKTFQSIQDAQTQLDLDLYTIQPVPTNATLETIRGQSGTDDGGIRYSITSYYQLPNNQWLTLTESSYLKNSTYTAGETKRYDDRSQDIQIGIIPAVQRQTYNRIQLDWTQYNRTFRLTAPTTALTQSQLIQIAQHITPAP